MAKKYSKSVPPSAPHDESIAADAYRYLNKSSRPWADYVVSPNRPVQDVFKGRDLSRVVERAPNSVSLLPEIDKSVRGGYSGEVSRGTRPTHKAGRRSYKRV
jgi:hypothetical protein